jgi:hypothetical protein
MLAWQMNECKCAALVEYYWQGTTKALKRKTYPSATSATTLPTNTTLQAQEFMRRSTPQSAYIWYKKKHSLMPSKQSGKSFSLQFSTHSTEHSPCLQG